MNLPSNTSPSQLLGRNTEREYSDAAKNLIKDKVILITGAGGSIGSEIVRQVTMLGAKKVYCIDQDEYALYKLQLETTGSALLTDDSLILADIRNESAISEIFDSVRPDIVYHAAANKHLPLLERSPISALTTNVIGTSIIANACVKYGVKVFINISTDKAASPTAVLGITKRLAEHVTTNISGQGTRVASVRFGNVLGSRGSFLPTLSWQIENDKDVMVTHPDVSRYFMTIPEASALVVEATVLADKGETYVLDMGESIKIMDIIQRFVEISGSKNPNIIFTGLREGEKMHEELYDSSEIHMETSHPSISKVSVGDGAFLNSAKIKTLISNAKMLVVPNQLRDFLKNVFVSA